MTSWPPVPRRMRITGVRPSLTVGVYGVRVRVLLPSTYADSAYVHFVLVQALITETRNVTLRSQAVSASLGSSQDIKLSVTRLNNALDNHIEAILVTLLEVLSF